MSESTKPYHDPLNPRKNGCLWVLLFLAILGGLFLLSLPMAIEYLESTQGPKLNPRTVLKDLNVAITAYEIDYGHFPVPESEQQGPDVSIRTRGLILPVLIGSVEAKALNPKEIKFIDLPLAKDRKFGLWQDGAERVLSDLWGEPYYIVLDTNKDGLIANPAFGAEKSDPKHAQFYQQHPQPETLPQRVIIYSSGPDRDPKTWQDNICSWRPH